LIVEPQEFDRAQAILRQYQIENRGWHWRAIAISRRLGLRCMAFCGWLRSWILFGRWVIFPGRRDAGVLDSVRVAKGEWGRLFTA